MLTRAKCRHRASWLAVAATSGKQIDLIPTLDVVKKTEPGRSATADRTSFRKAARYRFKNASPREGFRRMLVDPPAAAASLVAMAFVGLVKFAAFSALTAAVTRGVSTVLGLWSCLVGKNSSVGLMTDRLRLVGSCSNVSELTSRRCPPCPINIASTASSKRIARSNGVRPASFTALMFAPHAESRLNAPLRPAQAA